MSVTAFGRTSPLTGTTAMSQPVDASSAARSRPATGREASSAAMTKPSAVSVTRPPSGCACALTGRGMITMTPCRRPGNTRPRSYQVGL